MRTIRLICIAVLLAAAAAFVSASADPSLCPYDIHLSITYNMLSSKEQLLYDRLYDALRTGAESVGVPAGVTYDRAAWMLDFIYNEAAELCAYDRLNSRVTGSGNDMRLDLVYKMPISTQDAFIRTVTKEARSYAGKSESSGIRAIHDALCRRFTYGWLDGEDTQLTYFTLKNNKAVCNGYAQTAAMFAHFAGYTCSYVTGMVGENGVFDGAHAWNVACVDGRYIWFDATWDDAGSKAVTTWYGLDGAAMAKTHQPISQYRSITSLRTLLPEGGTATMHLDVNNSAGFARGITDRSGRTVLQRDLKSGEFYTPALVVWNDGRYAFSVNVSYSMDGQHVEWGQYAVQPGSNLAFRTNARAAWNASGSHEIVWYVDGIRVGVFTWKVK